MQTAGHGANFQSPTYGKSSHYVGYAYVDKTDLVEYNFTDPTITIEEELKTTRGT